MKTNMINTNSVMKNLKYICLFLMLFGMSFSPKAWAGMYLEYGGKTYNPGDELIFYVDLAGEDIVEGYLYNIELKNSSGWTYSSGTCASGKNYGYMDASISHTNVWITTNITGCYNNQYGTQYLTLYYMSEAVGIYDGSLTVTQSTKSYNGSVLQTGTFAIRMICYNSSGSAKTINFSVGYGSAPSSLSGTSITLPAIPDVCSAATTAGWAPFGWAEASVANNSSSALIVGKPGDTYYPDANRTLYAVYKKAGKTLTSETVFTLKSSQQTGTAQHMPTSGYILLTQITHGKWAISNTLLLNGLANYFVRFPGETGYQPTYNSSTNTMTTDSATLVWEVSTVTEGSPSTKYFMFKNVASGKYLGLSSTTSAQFYDNVCDNVKWEVHGTTKDGYYFKNKAIGYYLTNNSSYGWRGASSANGTTSNVHVWTQMSVTTESDKYQSALTMCGFTVTYNGNGKDGGGNPPTDNTVYTSEASVTVLGNTNSMTKTGHTFNGWNTSPDGNGTDRAAGATFTITSDVILYAKWAPKTYTVNLNKDGGSGGSASVTATYGQDMPSAGAAPTFSGYAFGGYYAQTGGGGTQYYNNSNPPASAHVWDVDVNPSTIYAKWTQVVKLDKNEGSADGSVTVTYHGNGTSSFTGVTRTGYTCKGYFDATSAGNEIITSGGALQSYTAARASYIDSNGKWCHSGATTLYAQWQAKSYTITLDQNGGSGGSTSVTVSYGSPMPSATMPTTPPTGSTFAGYYYGDTQYYAADGSSVRNWDIDEAVTLTARWTTNTPDLAIAPVNNVTISSTVPSLDEGDHTSYAFGSTVTLSYTGLESGYYWAGWDVYETGNPGNKVTVTSNQFLMPDHNVTVSAIVYPEANIKAWCPVITLTIADGGSPILVTSVGGQAIKAVRTLHLTVTGAPTTASVVTLNGNDLKFYADFSGTIREITSTNKLTCSSHALDKTIYVAYSPTGTYANDSWNSVSISAACLNSDESEASSIEVEDLVNVRRLPDNGTGSGQGFVIAAKVGGQWVAMPSSIIAGAQDGLPITVNDNEDPSNATLAPSSARYNLYNVYTSTGTNDRHKQYGDYAYLAGKGTKALKAAPSGVNISLGVNISTYSGGSEDAAYFEWLLSTTDKKNYTITNNARTPDKLKYYTTHDKFGMYSYNSQVITEFRLLPATFYEDAAAQIIEWKENSVVVMYTGSETTATTKVGTNDPSSSQTLANNKLTHGIYEFTTDQALTSNDGAILEISFGDGSTRKIEEIPIIITGNTSATTGRDGQNVIIRNGGKLTATAAENENYYNIYVYGGGILDIPTGTTLGVNNIILRAGGLITSGIGSSPTVSYDNSYPQVGISGTLVSAEDNIQYEYVTDYYNWYQLCLPFNAVLTSIHYPLEYYADNVLETNTGSWVIKRYDGATRATGDYNAWKDIEKDTPAKTEVTAGQGYIFWGAPKNLTIGSTTARSAWGIQRMTMAITADAVKTAENADKNVSVAAHPATKANDDGWNLIGNPYMVNLKSMTTTGLHACKLVEVKDANGNWTGKWEWNTETNIRYLTIPDAHFDTYAAKTVATAIGAGDLYPGRAFFVQIEGEATVVTFKTTDRASLMPAWRLNTEKDVDIETGIVMSNETLSDEVNFWIKDGKTEEYEYNADYPKTPNSSNFNLYGVHSHGDLSWIAISPEIAEGSMAIGYQVPAAGDYMLSLSETYVSDDIEHIFVTDHEASPEETVDLVERDYIFHVNQAETNNTRFTVSIKLKDEDTGTTTDIDRLKADSDVPIKFIYHNKMYILRNGIIYDATGKKVREINK